MNIYEKAKEFGIEKEEIKISENGEFFLAFSAIQKVINQTDNEIYGISETFESFREGKACVSTEIVLKNNTKNKCFGICSIGEVLKNGSSVKDEATAVAIAKGRSLRAALRWTNVDPNKLLLGDSSNPSADVFKKCQKHIHAVKHEMKMSDEHYRNLLFAATGKISTKYMTNEEIQLASARFISIKSRQVI